MTNGVTGAITNSIDVAQLVLYAFWISLQDCSTTCIARTSARAIRWSPTARVG